MGSNLPDTTPMSSLPFSLTFSRLDASNSNIFRCEPSWPCDTDGSSHDYSWRDSYSPLHVQSPGFTAGWNHRGQHVLHSIAPRTRQPWMSCVGKSDRKPLSEPLSPLHLPERRAQLPSTDDRASPSIHELLPLISSPEESRAAQYLAQQKPSRLLPPIDLVPQYHEPSTVAQESAIIRSQKESNLSSIFAPQDDRYPRSWELDSVASLDPTAADPPDPKYPQTCLGCTSSCPKPRSLHKISASRELRRQAGWPSADTQPVIEAAERSGPHSSTNSLESHAIHYERPCTPTSKPRLWIEASSSEESLEQAVLSLPYFCKR